MNAENNKIVDLKNLLQNHLTNGDIYLVSKIADQVLINNAHERKNLLIPQRLYGYLLTLEERTFTWLSLLPILLAFIVFIATHFFYFEAAFGRENGFVRSLEFNGFLIIVTLISIGIVADIYEKKLYAKERNQLYEEIRLANLGFYELIALLNNNKELKTIADLLKEDKEAAKSF